MTNVQPHRIVSNSASPAVSSETAPVYGVGTELADEPVLGSEAMAGGAGSASGSRDEQDKKDEKDDKDDDVIDEAEDEEGGEVRRPRIGQRPVAPTKGEIAEHYPLHLQYRSWCEHCRAGRGRVAPHRCEPSDREKMGVTIHSDYAFLGSEEAHADVQPSLVVYDDHKDAFWALGVKSKTVTESLVKYFKDVLDQSGYEGQRISMKSDQEPSIVALKRAVSAARTGETVPIESPVRSSKSNGRMENAIGVWQGQLRTIKHYTEAKMKRKMEIDSALFSWLVPFSTDIMNKYRVGADGRTAYERITGHRCKNMVIGFAEAVDFMLEPDKSI